MKITFLFLKSEFNSFDHFKSYAYTAYCHMGGNSINPEFFDGEDYYSFVLAGSPRLIFLMGAHFGAMSPLETVNEGHIFPQTVSIHI